MTETIKLTQFAKGAGCGCKIAPAVLEQILASSRTFAKNNLLIGNASNDDAAVYDLQNGQALIVTADFFMPIVDDAFTFGKVAAANALSDVYAMGGKPITAIAILGWPIEKLSAALAAKVIEGAKSICEEAGIVISGGHTIEAPEPFFGLSINGLIAKSDIKQNNTAQVGDLIFITKPLGVGILATAQKRAVLKPADESELIKQLTTLNSIGEVFGKQKYITAMTDVTGFGLLGHLIEMCEGANLTAYLQFSQIPQIEHAADYALNGIVPDATYRNWNAYSNKVQIAATVDGMQSFSILPDPQTNGGLLVTIRPDEVSHFLQIAKSMEQQVWQIGSMQLKSTHDIIID
jgi:selenide,water dikinase